VDINLIVALAAVVVAVAVPLFSAIVERSGALRLKTIEVVYEGKLSAYKAFAIAYGAIAQYVRDEPYNDFASSAYTAMLYAGAEFKSICEELLALTNAIPDAESKDEPQLKAQADKLFTQCMDILLKDIQINDYNRRTNRKNLPDRHYNSIPK